MSKCKCKHCLYSKEVRLHLDILLNHQLYEQREFFSNMYDFLLSVEMDNDYHSSILDGTWPNTKQILENSLAKVKGGDV